MDDKEITVRLGRQLRKYRKQSLLTLEEVAEKAGMDDKHLGKIERGKKSTTIVKLFRLTEILNIPCKVFEDMKKDNS